MAKQSRATVQKREKERARQQKQREKAQRRLAAKAQRAGGASAMAGDDPESISMRLGPHAVPTQWDETPPTD